MLGNEGRRFIGIDSFDFRDASLETVERNLERFGVPRPELLVGDVFELVGGGKLDGVSVGAWYYDALHTYEAQLDGLRIAEPFLAPGALLIVDDTDWEQVGSRDGRLPRRPATRAANPRDRRQGARLSPVVGGNAGPRMERVGPGVPGSTATCRGASGAG